RTCPGPPRASPSGCVVGARARVGGQGLQAGGVLVVVDQRDVALGRGRAGGVEDEVRLGGEEQRLEGVHAHAQDAVGRRRAVVHGDGVVAVGGDFGHAAGDDVVQNGRLDAAEVNDRVAQVG